MFCLEPLVLLSPYVGTLCYLTNLIKNLVLICWGLIFFVIEFLSELPKGARLLMDCEAAEVLQDIHEHMTVLSEDPKIKMPEY